MVGVFYVNTFDVSDPISTLDLKGVDITLEEWEAMDNISQIEYMRARGIISPAEVERAIKTADRKTQPETLNKLTKWTTEDEERLYISWGFFEDQILNRYLSFQHDDSLYQAQYDSSETFVTYEKNLVQKQKVYGKYSKEMDLDFLYPDQWDYSYNTLVGKVSDDPKDTIRGLTRLDYYSTIGSKQSKASTWTNKDKKRNRIPLREIFIRAQVIQDAFSTKGTVSESLRYILDVLEEASYGAFKLEFFGASAAGEKISFVDSNSPVMDTTGNGQFDEEEFNELFTFKPYSPESIIKNFDLSYMTGNNALQSMIMITNVDLNQQLFPFTDEDTKSQALRIMNSEIGNRSSRHREGMGIRYLPAQDIDVEKEHRNLAFMSSAGISEYYNQKGSLGIGHHKNKLTHYPSSGGGIVTKDLFDQIIQGGDGFINKYLSKYSNADRAAATIKAEVESNPNKDFITKTEYGMGLQSVDYEKNLYAKDLDTYFNLKVKRDFEHDMLSTQLPFEVTITLHGIGGLYPGDLFKVDYMPKQARDRQYFFISNVRHNITNQGWETVLHSIPKFRSKPEDKHYYKIPDKILIHPSFFSGQISDKLFEWFKDLDLSDLGNYQSPVFTATAKMGLKLGKEIRKRIWGMENNNYMFHEYYQLHAEYDIKSFDDIKLNKKGYVEKKGSPRGWSPTITYRDATSIRKGQEYFIVCVLDGFFIYNKSSPPSANMLKNIQKSVLNYEKFNSQTYPVQAMKKIKEEQQEFYDQKNSNVMSDEDAGTAENEEPKTEKDPVEPWKKFSEPEHWVKKNETSFWDAIDREQELIRQKYGPLPPADD